MKLEFSQQIFEKYSNIAFHEIESISLFLCVHICVCVCVYIQK